MPQNSNKASSSQPLLQGSGQVFTVEDIKSTIGHLQDHTTDSKTQPGLQKGSKIHLASGKMCRGYAKAGSSVNLPVGGASICTN
eukprot:6178181-Ditylum_brightwellii.AAC.1